MVSPEGFGLRPRTIGQLLDLTFRIYRSRFGAFALIGIVVSVVNLLVFTTGQRLFVGDTTLGSWQPTAPEEAWEFLGAVYLSLAVTIPLSLFAYAAGAMGITALTEETLFGRTISASQAMSLAWRRVLPAAATSLLVAIAIALAALACCLPAVPVGIMFALALPVVYLERKGPIAAMGRSYELVFNRGERGIAIETNWVRILLVGLLTIVVLYVLNVLASTPALVAGMAAAYRGAEPIQTALGPQFLPLTILIPLQLLASLIQGLFLALGVVPWALMYFDIRTRHEGLDLELAAGALSSDAPGDEGPA